MAIFLLSRFKQLPKGSDRRVHWWSVPINFWYVPSIFSVGNSLRIFILHIFKILQDLFMSFGTPLWVSEAQSMPNGFVSPSWTPLFLFSAAFPVPLSFYFWCVASHRSWEGSITQTHLHKEMQWCEYQLDIWNIKTHLELCQGWLLSFVDFFFFFYLARRNLRMTFLWLFNTFFTHLKNIIQDTFGPLSAMKPWWDISLEFLQSWNRPHGFLWHL